MYREAQGADALVDGVVSQLSVAEEIRYVLANLFGAELVGRTLEIAREVLDGAEVGTLSSRTGCFGKGS
jgi:hypothetical protein